MRILNVCHIVTTPPNAGGKIRIHHILSGVSKKQKIDKITCTAGGLLKKRNRINKNYSEYIFPMRIYQLAAFVLAKICNVSFDFVIPFLVRGRFTQKMRQLEKKADVILIEHPWLFQYVKRNTSKKIVLVCHNIESELYDTYVKDFPKCFRKNVKEYVKKVERHAIMNADHLICVSDENAQKIKKTYKKSNITVIPNGYTPKRYETKAAARKKLKVQNKQKVVLFCGSNHPPNKEAVRIIKKRIAPKLPEVLFIIAGSVEKRSKQKNVFCTGKVKNIDPFFAASDIAINPMRSGSGSNVKIPEYFGAGLQIITTERGIRGFSELKEHCTVADVTGFAQAIKNNKKKKQPNIQKYAWEQLAKEYEKVLNRITKTS